MLKKKLFIVILIFCFSSPYISGAATIELPQTGQTKCYDSSGTEIDCSDTGQDGDIRSGVAWPNPRFTDNSNETVTDGLTGLMWTKNANLPNSTATWQEALDYVASLNSSNYLGFNDWRLPNVNELESLVNSGEADTSIWLNAQGFTNVQSNLYWSSSTSDYETSSAWFVSMYEGYVFFNHKDSIYYVWPVRSGQSGPSVVSIPKTGQTVSYATGDDGNIQAGTTWHSPRFTDNGNQTVTDNLTGLMWTKNANLPNSTKTCQEALDYVASLNSTNYLGFNDWRLPNVNELESFANTGKSNISTWLYTQGFTNIQPSFYWSSSTYAVSTNSAWEVNMVYGHVYYFYKDSTSYVWPVRSGESASFVPSVISASPNSGEKGETLDVTISGTNFTGTESINFGSGITVVTYTVVSDTIITANITISSLATIGVRDVSVTTPDGTGEMSDGFSVTSGNLPDLKASSVKCPQTTKKRKTIAIKAVIKNIGKKTAPSSSAKFYLSTNNDSGTIDGDTPLAIKPVKSLKKRQNYVLIYKWKVKTVPGTYYIKALCDSKNAISELNENNNIKVSRKIKVK